MSVKWSVHVGESNVIDNLSRVYSDREITLSPSERN
jgi:hypothetical protein